MTTNLLIGFPEIPLSSIYWRSNQSWDPNWPLENNRSGPRYAITRLPTASSSSNLTRIEYDLGSSTTKASNFLAIARADLAQSASVNRVILRGSDSSPFCPSDISGLTCWLDATRGVTANSSNQVGTWADSSTNGRNFTQATTANKPIISRGDNLENMIAPSEDISGFTKVNGSVTANAVANPVDALVTADLFYENGAAGLHYFYPPAYGIFYIGRTYTISFYAKAAGRDQIRFYFNSTAFSGTSGASFNLTSVSVSNHGSATGTITSVGSGWCLCTATMTADGTGTTTGEIYLKDSGGTLSYTGDGTSGVYFWGLQMRDSAADSTYIQTTTAPQYRGVNGNKQIFFDGANDSLATTATTGDLFTNSAHTVFVVINYLTANGANDQFYLQGGTGTASFVVYESSGNMNSWINDGAGRNIAKAASIGNTIIVAVRHTGGNQYISINNGSETSGAAGNIATTSEVVRIGGTVSTTAIAGTVCEIITYNSAISTNDRTKVYQYLRDKWQTTAPKTENTFSTATLYGPRSDDYVASFATSSAYRYWWVDMDCSASSSFAHSKIAFGSWLDFGDTVIDFEISRNPSSATEFIAGSGAKHIGRSDQPKYKLRVTWEGLTDDLVRDFVTKCADRTYLYSGVYLYTSTSHEILDSQRLLHCKILDFTSESIKLDYNRLTVEFEEMIG